MHSSAQPLLTAEVGNCPLRGPMLVVGFSSGVRRPSRKGIALIKRRVGKRLGVAPHFFGPVPDTCKTSGAENLLVGLELSKFDHLVAVACIRDASEELQRISSKVFGRSTSKRKINRPGNRHVNRSRILRR